MVGLDGFFKMPLPGQCIATLYNKREAVMRKRDLNRLVCVADDSGSSVDDNNNINSNNDENKNILSLKQLKAIRNNKKKVVE